MTRILDNFRNNINGLRQCDEPIDKWNSILVYLPTSKLHPETNKEWELQSCPKSIEPLETLIQFLEKRIRALTVSNHLKPQSVNNPRAHTANPSDKSSKQPHSIRANVSTINDHSSEPNATICDFCGEAHPNFKCFKIMGKSPKEILELVREINACRNCLRKAKHATRDCPKSKCKKCGKPHHTLLHDTERQASSTPENHPEKVNSNNDARDPITYHYR